eukprot:COSAG05_NODE_666_length_8006_cov_12.857595_1_plen_585_part_10
MGDEYQSQGSQEVSFSQQSDLDLDDLDDGRMDGGGGSRAGRGGRGVGGGLARSVRDDMGISSQSSQDMVPQCLSSQPSDDSQSSSQTQEHGRMARVIFCCAAKGAMSTAPASPELVSRDKTSPRITFSFVMQEAGPFVVSQFGWGGPSISGTAEIELPIQIAGRQDAGALQSIKLEIPKWGDFVLQAVIVAIKDEEWVWTHHTRPHSAQPGHDNQFSELIFTVEHIHRCVPDPRSFVDNGCFLIAKNRAQEAAPQSSSQSNRTLAALDVRRQQPWMFVDNSHLAGAQGFGWAGGWVEQIAYENSGRVLEFHAHGADSSLTWPVKTPLDAGAYKLSMWVCVDDLYEASKMFKVELGLQNDRFGSNPQGENKLYMGCVGVFTGKMHRNRWEQISVRLDIPATAQSVDFCVLGGGRTGSFLATGLAVVKIGRDLQVTVRQDDDRQIVNRDCRVPFSEQESAALVHSVEMSLLGLDGENGSRHSTFTLNVGYADVDPNHDDDATIVDFNMKWRSGIVGKDQLTADNLDGAYYARRLIAAEYNETNVEQPTGTNGFDSIVFRSAKDSTQPLLYVRYHCYVEHFPPVFISH